MLIHPKKLLLLLPLRVSIPQAMLLRSLLSLTFRNKICSSDTNKVFLKEVLPKNSTITDSGMVSPVRVMVIIESDSVS